MFIGLKEVCRIPVYPTSLPSQAVSKLLGVNELIGKMKNLKWLFHPISIFVVAQVSWALLMFVWVRWYLTRNQEMEAIIQRIPLSDNLRTGQWVVLLEGCLLMGIILVGLYGIFVSFRKQVRLNKLQDAILSSVTHELKTPLASIRLYAETLLLRDLQKDEREKFLKRLLAEAERLQKLIDTVLISARIEAGNAASESERIDLIDCALTSWNRVYERVGERRAMKVDKKIFTEDGCFYMTCNPHQIAMIFDNLIDNAAKYTSEGGTIHLLIEAIEQHIIIRIADNGMGIEKGNLRKVFNKFYRIERNSLKKVHGSGLGLYVSHSIVKAHQGKIYATSEGPGRGATFSVEFERSPADY